MSLTLHSLRSLPEGPQRPAYQVTCKPGNATSEELLNEQDPPSHNFRSQEWVWELARQFSIGKSREAEIGGWGIWGQTKLPIGTLKRTKTRMVSYSSISPKVLVVSGSIL